MENMKIIKTVLPLFCNGTILEKKDEVNAKIRMFNEGNCILNQFDNAEALMQNLNNMSVAHKYYYYWVSDGFYPIRVSEVDWAELGLFALNLSTMEFENCSDLSDDGLQINMFSCDNLGYDIDSDQYNCECVYKLYDRQHKLVGEVNRTDWGAK